MKMISGKTVAALAIALGLSACGSPPEEKAGPATETAAATPAVETSAAAPAATEVAAGAKPAAFAQCAACHSTAAGKDGVGPSLAGVAGKKAGAAASFAYSDGFKGADLTWDDATLDKWLAAPAKLVPGTKMVFAGMADAAKRKEVIEYLKTLK